VSFWKKINFGEIFKQCSLRLKFLSENYGTRLEYNYQTLIKNSEAVETVSDGMWKHELSRRSNRHDKTFDLDGMLGELTFKMMTFQFFYLSSDGFMV